ncbi:MAG: dual specificity protein phosphatase 23, partial [Nitrososphaeraceae archaeon]|nr:dual specificity protein phosphatase 23 [Nitrososphaeraceae archaeon]
RSPCEMTLIGDVYRWIYSKFSSRPTNFSWVINNGLAGSGLPLSFDQFQWLVKNGIRTIVTVREIPLPFRWLSDPDIVNPHSKDKNFEKVNYLHLRVEDYHSPTVQEIDSTVKFIENEIVAKRPVLVHCAAGKGRTGTILAAYLLKKEDLSARDAITRIRNLRPGSIQTDSQEKSLYEYKKYLGEKTVN